MIAIWALLQYPILLPIAIFTIAYSAPTAYYLDQGFFVKDEILGALMLESQTHKGHCLERSLYLSDLMTKFGYKDHVIKVGRMEDFSGDYHAWVEYKGAVYETTIQNLQAGMDRNTLKKANCYIVYGEIIPGVLDDDPTRDRKEREKMYYAYGVKLLEHYLKTHDTDKLSNDSNRDHS